MATAEIHGMKRTGGTHLRVIEGGARSSDLLHELLYEIVSPRPNRARMAKLEAELLTPNTNPPVLVRSR